MERGGSGRERGRVWAGCLVLESELICLLQLRCHVVSQRAEKAADPEKEKAAFLVLKCIFLLSPPPPTSEFQTRLQQRAALLSVI